MTLFWRGIVTNYGTNLFWVLSDVRDVLKTSES